MGGFAGAPMSLRTADFVRLVDGVDAVAPGVMVLMDEEPSAMTMGVPPMITGGIVGADEGLDTFETRYARAGR